MGSSRIIFIDLPRALFKLLVAILIISLYFTYRWWSDPYLMSVNSPNLASSYQIKNLDFVKEFHHSLNSSSASDESRKIKGIYRITITSHRRSQTFTFDDPLLIYNRAEQKFLKPDKSLQNKLTGIISELKKRSPYGDLIPWQIINRELTLNRKFTLRDLATGKTFRVVRKSGFSLAQIRPVGDKDTQTIRKIFGGKWSWKRRAVVAHIGSMKAAACLAGMPQGEEGLFSLYFPDNNLNKSLNFANKLIIYKAAGKLDSLFKKAAPEESILGALTALDQRDTTLLNFFLTRPVKTDIIEKSGLIGLTLKKLYKVNEEKYKALVTVTYSSGPYNHWQSIYLQPIHNKELGFYQLNPAFLENILHK